MVREDLYQIEAILWSIFLCLLKITFFAEMKFWMVMLPVAVTFGIPIVISLLCAIVDLVTREKPAPYFCEGRAIHWDYKSKSMIEDPPGGKEDAK